MAQDFETISDLPNVDLLGNQSALKNDHMFGIGRECDHCFSNKSPNIVFFCMSMDYSGLGTIREMML
jgi:hypothetical protein